MLADGTDGQLITWGADGVATVVATGNAGQILTSAGAGAPPAFAAAPAAGDITTDTAWATAGDLIVATGNNAASVVNIGAEEVVARIGAGNIDGIAMAASTVLGRAAAGSIAAIACTAAGFALLDDAAASDQWTTLGGNAAAVAAVNAAGILLADAKSIEYTTPSASHTATGIIKTKTAGIALVFGDACYTGTDGKMEKALADDAAITIPATHLAIATIAENAAGLFLEKGEAHDDSWSFDVGLSVYLSAATAGLITKTMPTKVTGNQVQVLGTCLIADTIHWAPSPIVMEYA
jgi:hypothetical protein